MRKALAIIVFTLSWGTMQAALASDFSVCAGSSDELAVPACGRVIANKRTPKADRMRAYYNRGISMRNTGKTNEAISDYTQAIALDPKYASAYINRCSIYRQLERYDEALADCSKALELNPKSDMAYYNRGNIYRKKDMPDEAIADFNKAIAIKASNADYFFYRALTYQNKNQLDEAIADYGNALELTPTDFTTLSNRGLAYKKKGELDLAIADFDRALAAQPDASAFNSRGNVYYSKNNYDKALADYTNAIALDPTYTNSYYNRGTTFTEKGDYTAAIADLSRAIEQRPDDVASFNARASAYLKKGDTTKAVADYRSALVLAPDDADAKKGLAEAAGAQPPTGSEIANVKQPLSDTDAPKQAEATTVIDPSKSGKADAATMPTVRRVALVIGNSAYKSVARLPNPASDAQLIGDALRKAGVDDVTVAVDLDRAGMVSTLRAFTRKADNSDWAMVYYAGHGMEMDGKNYLIPVDASLETDRDVPDETLSLDRVLSAVSGARQLKLVVLDACRNNPFSSQMKVTVASRAVTRGLSRVEPVNATLVVYSAKEGTTAEDGDGANSVFATSISKRIVEPGVEINKVFRLVTRDVLTETGNRQQPFVYGSLPPDDFILVPPK